MVQRIRMLKRILCRFGVIPSGKVLRVPEDIDDKTAESWLNAGIAEEDKMLEGPPETKADTSKHKRRKKWPIL